MGTVEMAGSEVARVAAKGDNVAAVGARVRLGEEKMAAGMMVEPLELGLVRLVVD